MIGRKAALPLTPHGKSFALSWLDDDLLKKASEIIDG